MESIELLLIFILFRGYDLTLVEKIECSAEGEILFACTSVDTPKVPKTSGKNRNQIKVPNHLKLESYLKLDEFCIHLLASRLDIEAVEYITCIN